MVIDGCAHRTMNTVYHTAGGGGFAQRTMVTLHHTCTGDGHAQWTMNTMHRTGVGGHAQRTKKTNTTQLVDMFSVPEHYAPHKWRWTCLMDHEHTAPHTGGSTHG